MEIVPGEQEAELSGLRQSPPLSIPVELGIAWKPHSGEEVLERGWRPNISVDLCPL